MPKKVLVAIQEQMLRECDFIAQLECRTRSELIREAIRLYLDKAKQLHARTPQIDILSVEPRPGRPIVPGSGGINGSVVTGQFAPPALRDNGPRLEWDYTKLIGECE